MLRPLLFVFLTPLWLGLAALLYFGGREAESAKALARARPAPAAVDIAKFDAKRDIGPSGEVVLLGQVDLTMRVDFSHEKDGEVKDHYVLAPIYALDAKGIDEPARGVMVQRGRLTADQVQRFVVGKGPIGPVMRLDGELLRASDAQRGLEAGFQGQVLITRTALFVDPWEEGRAAVLAPNDFGRSGGIFFLAIALLSGVGGSLAQWRLVRRTRAETSGYVGSVY